jgi:DinB superfamily
MARPLLTTDQVRSILEETPDRLRVLTVGTSDALLHAPPVPGEWSVTEILAHLRACADMWGDAIDRIVATDHPTIRAVNPTSWIEHTDYRTLRFRPSLQAFSDQRARLLATLRSLPPEDWSRGATVVGGGAPIERTVHSYAARLARHERTHWKQVAATLRTLGT